MFFGSNDAQRQNEAAYEAHQRRLRETGQVGPESTAKCAIQPATDFIRVRRQGPKANASSLVAVGMTGTHGSNGVLLSPNDARRIGMALIDAADECDGKTLLRFDVDVPEALEGEADG